MLYFSLLVEKGETRFVLLAATFKKTIQIGGKLFYKINRVKIMIQLNITMIFFL